MRVGAERWVKMVYMTRGSGWMMRQARRKANKVPQRYRWRSMFLAGEVVVGEEMGRMREMRKSRVVNAFEKRQSSREQLVLGV
jgi:hypothetical protein